MEREEFLEQAMFLLQTFIDGADIESVKETLVQQGVEAEWIDSMLFTINNMANGRV